MGKNLWDKQRMRLGGLGGNRLKAKGEGGMDSDLRLNDRRDRRKKRTRLPRRPSKEGLLAMTVKKEKGLLAMTVKKEEGLLAMTVKKEEGLLAMTVKKEEGLLAMTDGEVLDG